MSFPEPSPLASALMCSGVASRLMCSELAKIYAIAVQTFEVTLYGHDFGGYAGALAALPTIIDAVSFDSPPIPWVSGFDTVVPLEQGSSDPSCHTQLISYTNNVSRVYAWRTLGDPDFSSIGGGAPGGFSRGNSFAPTYSGWFCGVSATYRTYTGGTDSTIYATKSRLVGLTSMRSSTVYGVTDTSGFQYSPTVTRAGQPISSPVGTIDFPRAGESFADFVAAMPTWPIDLNVSGYSGQCMWLAPPYIDG